MSDNLPNSPDSYNGKVYYTIRLDGEELHLVVNTDPRSFENVKLFAGDTFYPPADANYKELTWEHLGYTSNHLDVRKLKVTYFFQEMERKTQALVSVSGMAILKMVKMC